ncbi:MAG: hypothetical protein AAF829_06760 [Pseudomonadota bacterium]|mgnify:CR=1 FL=1
MPPLVAIFAWPFVSTVLFQKYTILVAVTATILGGYLLLPHGTVFDLPLLPALDKYSVPALTALLLVLALPQKKKSVPFLGLVPNHSVLNILLLGLLVGTALTVLTNSDAVRYGPTVLPAMRPYDGFSIVLSSFVMVLPLILGRSLFFTQKGRRVLLFALVLGGIAYSFLALFEVRMSPLLNQWIYGYFPHSWIQHKRGGGWRPIVFLQHGLFLGLFFAMCTLAAVGAMRASARHAGLLIFAVVWLFATLVLVKSLGALLIAVALLPVVLFLSRRMQITVAALICAAFLTYPVIRGSDVFSPVRVEQAFARISTERAQSLRVRMEHEQRLLDKAQERPLFGWGGWGRWRIFDEVTGYDVTISDGHWVITISEGGWVRYVAIYGLLTGPIFLLLWRQRRDPADIETSVLCVILAGNMIDLVPNSGLTPLTFLIAGALWGRVEAGQSDQAVTQPDGSRETVTKPAPVYARSFEMPLIEPYNRPTQKGLQDSKAGPAYMRPPQADRKPSVK